MLQATAEPAREILEVERIDVVADKGYFKTEEEAVAAYRAALEEGVALIDWAGETQTGLGKALDLFKQRSRGA